MKSKKLIFAMAAMAAMAGFGVVVAKTPHSLNKATKKINDNQIKVYELDSTKKQISSFPVDVDLVKIYEKDGWIKVGNLADGSVGWINEKQYRQAQEELYKPETMFIYVSRSKSNHGDPALTFLAYNNGKEMSQKEARKMYETLRSEQKKENDKWRIFESRLWGHTVQPWLGFPLVPFH